MSCRTLILKNVRVPELLALADENLQSLSLQEDEANIYISSPLPRLDILTRLTRLELLERDGDADNSIEIRGLQLQELVLIDCKCLAQELFVPGALTTLRKLHIEISHFISDESMMKNLPDSRRQELKAVGEITLGLPHLYQVSGACTLFLVGMRQGLKSWREADFIEGTMVSCKSYHCCSLSQMKVWTKPLDWE